MKKSSILLMFLLLITQSIFGQVSKVDSLYEVGICDGNGYCIPRLSGLPRPKGVELKYKKGRDYKIRTNITGTSYATPLDGNVLLDAKIRFPVVLKDNFTMVVGVRYNTEEFNFEQEQSRSNEFYKSLDNKLLKSIGTSVYIIKPFIGNKFLIGRVNFRLSGDFAQSELDDYFRSSLTVVYGKRASKNVSWGVGLNYSYNFGRQTLLPVFSYSRKFSDKWSMAAILPVNLGFTYIINDKNVVRIVNRVTGDSYNVKVKNYTQDNLFLKKSDLLSSVVYEREIHDFLWFSAAVGNQFNINFDLFEENTFQKRGTPEIDNSLSNTLFFEVGIFLVPPKK